MGRQDEIVKERLRKLKQLRTLDINPYLSKFEAKNKIAELQEKYSTLKQEEKTNDKVSIAGRITGIRDIGKIIFASINDGTSMIQIVIQDKETPKEAIEFFRKYFDEGDFIGIEGTVLRTKRGELSVLMQSVKLLTKSIYPLPDKFHGLKDDDERFRKRYLEILMDPKVKEMFLRKAKFWNCIRNFLVLKGFTEVETPILENSAGGASATPFCTHHNALDMDVFLRISMGELWQKKLMIGGFAKTFEIGRQFRNEGMDNEHLQDYTQMEFYWAYANYEDGMQLVEEMYKSIARQVYGKTKFTFGEHEFDLENKWERIDYSDTIKKMTGLDIWNADYDEIKNKLDELAIEYEKKSSKINLIDCLWKYCRKKISGPAFLNGQPVEISPLAKRSSLDPRKVEQFQIILAGSELGNGYSELNDPFDQEERFKEQQAIKDAGDSEAQSHDFDFVEALKYGMPPTCGFGVSERLFAFFEGKAIRETVIFPLMKSSANTLKKKKKSEQNKK